MNWSGHSLANDVNWRVGVGGVAVAKIIVAEGERMVVERTRTIIIVIMMKKEVILLFLVDSVVVIILCECDWYAWRTFGDENTRCWGVDEA